MMERRAFLRGSLSIGIVAAVGPALIEVPAPQTPIQIWGRDSLTLSPAALERMNQRMLLRLFREEIHNAIDPPEWDVEPQDRPTLDETRIEIQARCQAFWAMVVERGALKGVSGDAVWDPETRKLTAEYRITPKVEVPEYTVAFVMDFTELSVPSVESQTA